MFSDRRIGTGLEVRRSLGSAELGDEAIGIEIEEPDLGIGCFQSGQHVITGRGWGNREQKPVLRLKVEAWLRGPDGSSRGVSRVSVVQKGGALDVELG